MEHPADLASHTIREIIAQILGAPVSFISEEACIRRSLKPGEVFKPKYPCLVTVNGERIKSTE